MKIYFNWAQSFTLLKSVSSSEVVTGPVGIPESQMSQVKVDSEGTNTGKSTVFKIFFESVRIQKCDSIAAPGLGQRVMVLGNEMREKRSPDVIRVSRPRWLRGSPATRQ